MICIGTSILHYTASKQLQTKQYFEFQSVAAHCSLLTVTQTEMGTTETVRTYTNLSLEIQL